MQLATYLENKAASEHKGGDGNRRAAFSPAPTLHVRKLPCGPWRRLSEGHR